MQLDFTTDLLDLAKKHGYHSVVQLDFTTDLLVQQKTMGWAGFFRSTPVHHPVHVPILDRLPSNLGQNPVLCPWSKIAGFKNAAAVDHLHHEKSAMVLGIPCLVKPRFKMV